MFGSRINQYTIASRIGVQTAQRQSVSWFSPQNQKLLIRHQIGPIVEQTGHTGFATIAYQVLDKLVRVVLCVLELGARFRLTRLGE